MTSQRLHDKFPAGTAFYDCAKGTPVTVIPAPGGLDVFAWDTGLPRPFSYNTVISDGVRIDETAFRKLAPPEIHITRALNLWDEPGKQDVRELLAVVDRERLNVLGIEPAVTKRPAKDLKPDASPTPAEGLIHLAFTLLKWTIYVGIAIWLFKAIFG